MTDESPFLSRAVELARTGMMSGAGGPFGAVVVMEGEIVGEGWNQVTSTNDPTAHAEVVAIRDACRRLNRFDLRGGTIYSSCEPCPMCLASILWARLDRLVYANTRVDAADIGFDDALIYDQVALPPAKRTLVCEHRPSPEALSVFRAWTETPDRTPY